MPVFSIQCSVFSWDCRRRRKETLIFPFDKSRLHARDGMKQAQIEIRVSLRRLLQSVFIWTRRGVVDLRGFRPQCRTGGFTLRVHGLLGNRNWKDELRESHFSVVSKSGTRGARPSKTRRSSLLICSFGFTIDIVSYIHYQ